MPYKTKVRIKSCQLQINDELKLGDQPFDGTAEVQEVSVGTKWTRVTFTDEELGTWSLKYGVDDEVTVLREKMTRAELESTWHSQAAHLARVAIDEADKLVQEAKQKLLDDLDYRPDYHRWAYANYIEAQTKRTIWRSVAKLAKVDDMGLVEAMRIVRDELTDEIVRYRHESYSTSGLTNSVEDIERDAKAQWVDRMKFHVPPRLSR